ncbi:hypothetical protein ENUP19_0108G0001 [Entamoeba nuttalli]|uniref:Uncharacterized protein n=1 Tax=Entamoeba nuttalli TaxID=412467 RepID=A0ABQ0DHS4_9EUKA
MTSIINDIENENGEDDKCSIDTFTYKIKIYCNNNRSQPNEDKNKPYDLRINEKSSKYIITIKLKSTDSVIKYNTCIILIVLFVTIITYSL